MKIAIYSGAIPSTTFIENLIKGLASSGEQVLLFGKVRTRIFYNHSNIFVYSTPEAKLIVVWFVLKNQLRLWLQSRQKFRALKQHIQSIEKSKPQRWRLWAKYLPVVLHLPDIFHIQWAKATEEWLFLKELFGVKLVLSLRGTHINYSPVADLSLAASYRRSFLKIDGFHAVSKTIAKEAIQYGARLDKTVVIYTGIDLEKVSAFEKKDFTFHQVVHLLSVGRFHWVKGYHYALDALKTLIDKGYDLHYTIIAEGASEEILYQIHNLGLQKRVRLIGKLPQKEVFRYMQASDLLLLPSVEEGIANVVLEAMAIGLPVLSSDCGGMPEILEDGVNGFLFANRNVDNLVEKCIEFVQLSDTERATLAKRGQETIRLQHELPQMAAGMLELYQMVVEDATLHENRLSITGTARVL